MESRNTEATMAYDGGFDHEKLDVYRLSIEFPAPCGANTYVPGFISIRPPSGGELPHPCTLHPTPDIEHEHEHGTSTNTRANPLFGSP